MKTLSTVFTVLITAIVSVLLSFWQMNSTLEKRVFDMYGGGDAGIEMMLYLQTGVPQDFMGNPYNFEDSVSAYSGELDCSLIHREYQIGLGMDIDSIGYTIYDCDKVIGFIPYGQSTLMDSLIRTNNL